MMSLFLTKFKTFCLPLLGINLTHIDVRNLALSKRFGVFEYELRI